MYKSRRQVELFFKRTTRHLRIKRFLGPGENAVIIRPNVLRQPWMTAEDRLIEIAGQGGNGPWNARIAPKVIDPAHLVQYGCDQTVGFPQQDQQICTRTTGYKHAMNQEISVWPL